MKVGKEIQKSPVPKDYGVVNSNWDVNHVCVICGDWPLFVNWHAEIILKWLI